MCIEIFFTNLYETFIILKRIERDMIKNVIGLHVKYPLFLSDFNETRIFPADFRKILILHNLIQIRPVGVELFHADI
jgi:hypothetical protein